MQNTAKIEILISNKTAPLTKIAVGRKRLDKSIKK